MFHEYEFDTAVLLVDASGSVLYNKIRVDGVDTRVFDYMLRLAQQLPEARFRVAFWSSDQGGRDGAWMIPFEVARDKLAQVFRVAEAKITDASLTMPNLAFERLAASDWLARLTANAPSARVYLFTDGEMGWGGISAVDKSRIGQRTAAAIRALTERFNVQIHIVAVENAARDFERAESTQTAVGCDVYRAIADNGLTRCVNRFTSYTPNHPGGFRQIDRNTAPGGFIPFRDKYFDPARTGEFIAWLRTEIAGAGESALVATVQALAPTVSALTRDKPPRLAGAITDTFCRLFEGTPLEPALVRMVLDEAVQQERGGSGEIFSAYRAKMRDLYRQANRLLERDVLAATGSGADTRFVTLPIGGRVVATGRARAVDCGLRVRSVGYPNSCIRACDNVRVATAKSEGVGAEDATGAAGNAAPTDNAEAAASAGSAGSTKAEASTAVQASALIPILPVPDAPSPLNEQCLRQWIRVVVAREYGVGASDDVVIYLVLGVTVRAVASDMAAAGNSARTMQPAQSAVVQAYRTLSHTMLRKARANSERREIDLIRNGELPIPSSGKLEHFDNMMRVVASRLDIGLPPRALWYAMCIALGDEIAVNKQLPHCADEVRALGVEPGDVLSLLKPLVAGGADATGSASSAHNRADNGAGGSDSAVGAAGAVCASGIIGGISVVEIPDTYTLDYNCLITLESVESVGGYKFLPHGTCSPRCVLSREGYESLLGSQTPICPICYSTLSRTDFEQVGPRPDISATMAELVAADRTRRGPATRADLDMVSVDTAGAGPAVGAGTRIRAGVGAGVGAGASAVAGDTVRTVVFLRGVVGSGKTAFASRLREAVEAAGGKCIVEGTDKYMSQGWSFKRASSTIKQNLLAFRDRVGDAAPRVAVVDTCGDRSDASVFGVDFSKWRHVDYWPNLPAGAQTPPGELEEYFAWSLRNVLQRKGSGDFYLCPDGAGVRTCIEVHQRKSRALFGCDYVLPGGTTADLPTASVIAAISPAADAYVGKLPDVGKSAAGLCETLLHAQ
jgi:hypothetical protein